MFYYFMTHRNNGKVYLIRISEKNDKEVYKYLSSKYHVDNNSIDCLMATDDVGEAIKNWAKVQGVYLNPVESGLLGIVLDYLYNVKMGKLPEVTPMDIQLVMDADKDNYFRNNFKNYLKSKIETNYEEKRRHPNYILNIFYDSICKDSVLLSELLWIDKCLAKQVTYLVNKAQYEQVYKLLENSQMSFRNYIDFSKVSGIDQDTYLPTVFKKYNPVRKSFIKYDSKSCNRYLEIMDNSVKQEVESISDYVLCTKYIPDISKKEEYLKNINRYFNLNIRNSTDWEKVGSKVIDKYVFDLSQVFPNKGRKFVLLPYPSSTKNVENMVTTIVKRAAQKNEQFIDGSNLISREVTEGTASSGDDSNHRDVLKHMKSIKIFDEIQNYRGYLFIVIDDVSTTGASLEAADRWLEKYQGIPVENIINFVYGKSLNWYSFIENERIKPYAQNYDSKKIQIQKEPEEIAAIIWDFDNTLLDKNKDDFYPELERLIQNSKCKNIIVTNRSENTMKEKHLERLCSMGIAKSDIFLYSTYNNTGDKKSEYSSLVQSYVEDDLQKLYWKYRWWKELSDAPNSAKVVHFSKPSVETIRRVHKSKYGGCYYESIFKHKEIGIGNNLSDIEAYKKAGVFAILVNYGNKISLSNNPNSEIYTKDFKVRPDLVFESQEELINWLESKLEIKREVQWDDDMPF